MVITERVLDILMLLRLCKFLTAAQIRRWRVQSDKDGSVTREVLRKMLSAGFVKRFKAEVVDPLSNSSAPVYVPTEAGCAVLATKRGDMRLLLDCPPPVSWQNLAHYVCVSEWLLVLNAAVARQTVATIAGLVLEHDIVNPAEDDPVKRFKLYTVVKEEKGGKKIVCVPDALVVLQIGSLQNAYYLELERGTDTPMRVAAKKSPGYAGLFETKKFKGHAPDVQNMRVLAVCPNAAYRCKRRLKSAALGR